MSLIVQNPWLMFLLFGICIFVISYRWSPLIVQRLYKKTLHSQKEILTIMENMRIQADRKKMIVWFWVFTICMGVLPVFIVLPNILLGVVLGLMTFLFSWVGLTYVMKNLWNRYCDIVVEQMSEGMTLMANGIKVGLSVTQSMERIVRRMKGPLSSEFTLVLNKIKLGMSLEEALNEMDNRVQRPDVTMFVTSVNILKETGGNLAETFAVIAETLRSRQKVNSKIKALTAQGMMQARIISGIPFVLMGMFYFLNKEYIILLFTTILGWISVTFIVILVIIGGQMMKKVATISV